MSASPSAFPILRTKLHRPPVAADLVTRDALIQRLEAGRHLPLTLVSAPAGYGKTTLISRWLETRETSSAWVSLDETDGSVEVFLRYVVAAVRTLFPEACADLLGQLNPNRMPSLDVLAGFLCNDLDELGQPFVLVLDDYHCLRQPAVSELMDRLLRHPPHGFHLVLLSRRDPPLSLVSLRAQSRMTEIRMRDLQFSNSESALFLESSIGRPFEGQALSRLQTCTEGWPVALRLAAVALRHGGDRAVELAKGLGDSREVQEYLVTEVLAHQSPAVRDWLCRTSILDRFCAPLCEAVCTPLESVDEQVDDGGTPLSGPGFLHTLEEKGLLSVALDERREWFRYHHLFQESLRRHLARERGPTLVAALHLQAALWFEGQGLIEEALRHLLSAGDPAAAGRLIVRLRGEIAEHEHWHRLDRWLSLLPPSLVSGDPELLILQAWSAEYRAHLGETSRLLTEVEALIADLPEDTRRQRLRGEIATLRSRELYGVGQVRPARIQAEEALRLMPPEMRGERGYARMVLAGALQREGKCPLAYDMLHEALEHEARDSPTYRGRIIITLAAIQWMDGDLRALEQTTATMSRLGEDHQLDDTVHSSRYFRGIAQYHRDHLADAEENLAIVTSKSTAARFKLVIHASFCLALIHHIKERPRQARQVLELLLTGLLEVGNTMALPLVRAYQADLALRQGRLAEAVQWAETYDPRELWKGLEVHWADTTAVKAFIQQGTQAALARAETLLDSLRRYLESIHYRRFLIDIEALQALLHDARGQERAALEALKRAVTLAQTGRWIRLFVDLGPDFTRLLGRLEVEGDTRRYVEEILIACPSEVRVASENESTPAPRQPLPEPLTPRELEILIHLAKRLSNKEIGARLGISSTTVKRHTNNIYEKLAVHGRREAADKAAALGLLKVG